MAYLDQFKIETIVNAAGVQPGVDKTVDGLKQVENATKKGAEEAAAAGAKINSAVFEPGDFSLAISVRGGADNGKLRPIRTTSRPSSATPHSFAKSKSPVAAGSFVVVILPTPPTPFAFCRISAVSLCSPQLSQRCFHDPKVPLVPLREIFIWRL